VGTGQAAAFTYDLATSIVYTRQGNPAWATQERDGYEPIRSDDKFYGNKTGEVKPDWVDLTKVAIPQADEQQRLLANLILTMNLNKKPLPRFWYFPRGKKAVVIMTGDDHGNNGTEGRFDRFKQQSPAGCSVANWECVRGTSYIYPSTPLTKAKADAYTAEGFEVGLHVSTNCADFTPAQLESFYTDQIQQWTTKYVGTTSAKMPSDSTQRHHCITWSDWVTGAQTQFNHGIRLDTNYYFWPPEWVANVPGMFTGSAMPMRFAGLDGTLIDVYHAATQMTDESGQGYPFTIDTLLDRATEAPGHPEGYYGAYTINAHTDVAQIPESEAVVASALARSVPIVSSRQMLQWLDGRNGSSFGSIAWNSTTNALSFQVSAGTGANGLQAMVPTRFTNKVLTGITGPSGPITPTTDTIKGIEYAFFSAAAGSYAANYAVDSTAPTVTATSPTNGATGVSLGAKVTATFSEAMDATTITASAFELRGPAPNNTLVPATVSYNASTRTATLTPSANLAGSTTYTATVKSGGVKDLAGNALNNPPADVSWSFTTEEQPCSSNPCSAWSSSTTPGTPSVSDPNAVELGVKFKVDLDGYITGIRFYKGNTNTGT
ncbi:MAG TPA: Ig-like domain-containing protein, partial [Candidatus Competibacteraceae bacterium]|nr:Ig-like domain-containing protein [Candidatus Competibacteraceae bacterium]